MSDEEPDDLPEQEPPKKQRRVPLDSQGRRIPGSALVEAARTLLGQGMSDGDVKRQMAKVYGLATRSFEKYVAKARERNRESLGVTAADAKSDSIAYWSGRLQLAEKTLAQAQRRMQDAYKRIDQANEILDDDDAIQERKEQAQFTLEKCTSQIETYRRQMYNATREATDFRDRLDRIVGTLAPVKHAQTDASGVDLPATAPVIHCEPTSRESAMMFVNQVLDAIEPLGLRIVNEAGHRMLRDGTFEGDETLLLPPPQNTSAGS